MKIRFLGGAGTVTGSCSILQACGKRFCVDCGLHQGASAIEARNRETGLYDPARLDFVLLTHAHMDHAGLLPAMSANGFKGPIYCTRPTADLLDVMLEDSARIQESDAELAARKMRRRGRRNPPPPLYTVEDAQACCSLIRSQDYHAAFEPAPSIKATFHDAGHILGSGTLRLEIEEDGKSTSLIFSGDIGRPQAPLVRDPETPPLADYIFMESTYGDRNHKNEDQSEDELAEAIAWSWKHGEKTIIPAFAVERTQEIIYSLYKLSKSGRLPEDMAIFVDSPLAIKATRIFARHREVFDAQTQALFSDKGAAEFMRRVRYTPRPGESQCINSYAGPAIVISASGMCNAGRVRHHLKHNLWRPGVAIVFVGFQAQGTPGRMLVENARKINIFGEEVQVAARIFTINGFSAHAGQSQLIDWLRPLVSSPQKPHVTLLHGESSAQKTLAALIECEFGITPGIPGYLDEMTADAVIRPGGTAPEAPGFEALLGELEGQWGELRRKMDNLPQKSWEEQKQAEEELHSLRDALANLLDRV